MLKLLVETVPSLAAQERRPVKHLFARMPSDQSSCAGSAIAAPQASKSATSKHTPAGVAELAEARDELDRMRATVVDQAIARSIHVEDRESLPH